MPIEMGVWRINRLANASGQGETLTKLSSSRFDNEARLESLLEQQLDVLGLDLMPMGRQVQTPSGKRADILAIDTTGELFVIELKKDRTPRDVGIGEVKGDRVKATDFKVQLNGQLVPLTRLLMSEEEGSG
jgi:hypothetical protein